jgi:hypothetical protein
MTDLRSPLAKARDEFLDSDSGRDMCDSRNLPATAFSQYLRNRLEQAFVAGWNARDARNAGVTS